MADIYNETHKSGGNFRDPILNKSPYGDTSRTRESGTESVKTNMDGIVAKLEDLYESGETLIKTQIELARTELSEKIDQLQKGVTRWTSGAVLAFFGVQILLLTTVLILNFWMTLWLAALIVGLALVAIGGALVVSGKNELKPENLKPDRTMRSVRESAQTIKKEMK